MARDAACAALSALLLVTLATLVVGHGDNLCGAATEDEGGIECPYGGGHFRTQPLLWICVHGTCAKRCPIGYNKNLKGLASGGAYPFSGVYCNSIEGTNVTVLMSERHTVADSVCKYNTDCDIYGPGYLCNFYSATADKINEHPTPRCALPAAPLSFPLVPVCWKNPLCKTNTNGVCPP